MISPFESKLIKEVGSDRVISYGLSSYGYDIRLCPTDFRLVCGNSKDEIDPKSFDDTSVYKVEIIDNKYFWLPPHAYALGVSVEKFIMPDNVTAIALGKSTYARCGILVNVTPLEAGWSGHLTIEIANLTNAPCKIYANEGIAQLLFYQGQRCNTTYSERNGKYQNQPHSVVLPKV
jgi:dCTP deaminase